MCRTMRFRFFAAALILPALLAGAQEQTRHFTHGPILGRPEAHAMGVWARTGVPDTFLVRYGTAPDALNQLSEPVQTSLEHDNTGWVHLTGLEANTRYYYEVIFSDMHEHAHAGRSGTFRTLPDPAEYVAPELNPRGLFNFSFEFACGNNIKYYNTNGPAMPAFHTMLERIADKIDFAILNGDWLYEYKREYRPAQWAAQQGIGETAIPEILRIAPSLTGVWENYKYFLEQAPVLTEWHSRVPSYFTYDDHEILNDVWGAGEAGLRDRRAAFRDIGAQAWYDYIGWSNPVETQQGIQFGRAKFEAGSDVLTDAAADFTQLDLAQITNLMVHWGTPDAGVNDNALDGAGGDPNAGVYGLVEVLDAHHLRIAPAADADGEQSYSIGRRSWFKRSVGNCDFFFLDTRGQRGMHDVQNPGKPGLSMLGPAQRDWLIDGVAKSKADFIFVISSVNFTIPHVGGELIRGAAANKDEAWTVFLDERERFIRQWDALPQPVFVLTGDLHNSFAIQISDNVWEFASGPHNSNNHTIADEGMHPPNGAFEWGPRTVDIRWSSYIHPDIPREQLRYPRYCVVQVNNAVNNPLELGGERYIAYPRPQVIFQFFDGYTGDMLYSETVLAAPPGI